MPRTSSSPRSTRSACRARPTPTWRSGSRSCARPSRTLECCASLFLSFLLSATSQSLILTLVRSYRIFGIFPIIQWAQSLNDPARQPKDKQLLTLQRLQCLSMILYYPLEHFCTSLPPRCFVRALAAQS